MAIKKYSVKASAEAKAVVASKGEYISAAQFSDTLKSAKKKFNEKFKKGPYACAEVQGMGYIYYNDGSKIYVPNVLRSYDDALAQVKKLNAGGTGKVAASKSFKKTVKASSSLKVKPYVINKGQSGEYYGLKNAEDNQVLHSAPNNWKSKKGAIAWAKKKGYEVVESACGKKSVKAAHYKAKTGGWNYDNPETNKFLFLYKHRWYTGYKTFDECLADVIDTVGIDNIISEGVEIFKENSAGYSIESWDSSEVYEAANDASIARNKKSIKAGRYSDVVPYENRKYWYFTTHGIGPGMLPKGVNVLDTQEGQNRKGTWGDYILLDAVLNTDELREYDLVELAPLDKEPTIKPYKNKNTISVFDSCGKKSVKASELLSGIDKLPERGKVITKTINGDPTVIVGIGDNKYMYRSYLNKASASGDVQFIRNLIKKGEVPANAVKNLGYKLYTASDDVESACGKKPVRATTSSSKWEETPHTIYMHGQAKEMSKYTTDRNGDTPMMVLPYFDRKSDSIVYKLAIFGPLDAVDNNRPFDVSDYLIDEQFDSSKEAMEYGERYFKDLAADKVWELQHGVESSKSVKSFGVKASKSTKKKVSAAQGYWADDINAESYRKILQTLNDYLIANYDGKTIGDVEIGVSGLRSVKNGIGSKIEIMFYCPDYNKDTKLEIISAPELRSKFLGRVSDAPFKFDDEFMIRQSGCKQVVVDKINEIADMLSNGSIEGACGKKHTVKASTAAKKRKAIKASGIQNDIVMYFNGDNVYQGSVYDLADAVENLCYDDEVNAKFQEWCNQFGDPFDFDGSPIDTARVFTDIIIHEAEEAPETEDGGSQFYEDGNGILDFEIFYANDSIYSAKSIKAGINAPDTEGPLCVCEHCLQGIESHEGRQVIYNEISEFDIEPEDRLICDWCEEESDILYQISPDEVEGAKSIHAYIDEYPNWVYDWSESKTKKNKQLYDSKLNEWYDKAESMYPNFYQLKGDDRKNAISDVNKAVGFTMDDVFTSIDIQCSDADGIADEWEDIREIANQDSYEYDGFDDSDMLEYVDSFLQDASSGAWLSTDHVVYNGPDDWEVSAGLSPEAVESDFWFFLDDVDHELYEDMLESELANPLDEDPVNYTYNQNAINGNEFYIQFYPNNNQVSAPQIDFDEKYLTPEWLKRLTEIRKAYEDSRIAAYTEFQNGLGSFLANGITASTDITAEINIGNKTKYSDNPIYEFSDYVEKLSDGVQKILGDDFEVTASDEAITFTKDGEVVYIQPTEEIIPEPEDLESDIDELATAVNSVLYDKAMREDFDRAWDDTYDEDYATQVVELSRDINCAEETVDIDDLEYITGDSDDLPDMGYGFDSNGDPIDESTVEELERIAQEILDKSEIHNVDEYADLHNFNYYASIPYIQESFDITFTYVADIYELSERGLVNDYGIFTTVAPYNIHFNVRCKNGEVEYAECTDVDMKDNYGKDVELKNFNLDALVQFATDLVNPVAKDIYNGTTNI